MWLKSRGTRMVHVVPNDSEGEDLVLPVPAPQFFKG